MATPGLEPPSDGLFGDYPDVDQRSCRLLGPTALVVQGLMGVLVILSLVYKRHREKPMRPWRIWLFDVSKQVVGQMFVHGVNVLISDMTAHRSRGGNACVFYFLNILIDTTVGVALIYVILRVLTHLLSEKLQLKGFESGQYGSPPSFTYWAKQAAVYVLALTSMKLLVLFMVAIIPGIVKFGKWLLSWTQVVDSDALQVVFTMGLFPIFMNILQFWLIDSIVKASTSSDFLASNLQRDAPDEGDREPLFVDNSDDEGDDTRHDIENPRPRSQSRSLSLSRDMSKSTQGLLVPEEQKNSGPSTPGSTSESRERSTPMHAYPPSLSSSVPSLTSSSHPTSPSSSVNQPRKYNRSPPMSDNQPAVNFPLLLTPIPGPPRMDYLIEKSTTQEQEWTESWDDSDDWTNKVGDEEWTLTRKRVDDMEGSVKDTWNSNHFGAMTIGP